METNSSPMRYIRSNFRSTVSSLVSIYGFPCYFIYTAKAVYYIAEMPNLSLIKSISIINPSRGREMLEPLSSCQLIGTSFIL